MWATGQVCPVRPVGTDARLGGGISGGSDEMERLKQAFAEDRSARKMLESAGAPAQLLASLRTLGGETGAAVSGYLDLVGNRLIDGFDIAEPTAIELPDALLRAIRIAVSKKPESPRTSMLALPKFARWFLPRTRTSLTNCSGRPA